jgi:hypothetical protein
MIRKLWIGGMVLALSLVSVAVAAAEQATPRQFDLPIKVLYNARQVAFPDARPKMDGNRILVPVRFVAETLGANVDFRDKLVTIRQEGKVIELPIGSDVAKVNGQPITLDTKAVAEKGRTYVPLRFVSEALGQTVEWDSVARFVWIGHKNVPTLEEVTEKEDLEPYLHYFTGVKAEGVLKIWDYLSPDFGKLHKTVRIIKEKDWPLIIAGTTINRIDRVVIDGKEYFRTVSTKKGLLGTSFYLLQTDQPLKLRGEDIHMREFISDFRVFYNSVTHSSDEQFFGIKDYKKLKLKDAEYIGINTQSDSVILMENYFK